MRPHHLPRGAALTAMTPDPTQGVPTTRVQPAGFVATGDDQALVTLLGSCVAACLYDNTAGVGGMNHFLLPEGAAACDGVPARYGIHAMELLINALLKLGARRNRLNAKVFGGGNVLRGFAIDPVGTRNARFVLSYLDAERIPVIAQDLGDVHPRKVVFFPRTGRTLVRRLPPVQHDAIVRAETAYRGRIAQAPVSGGVELF